MNSKINKFWFLNISDRPSRLAVFYDDLNIETLERIEVNNFNNFISSCGGLLGLFLGVSVLSIIEFIYYFTLRLFWTIRRSTSSNIVTPFPTSNINGHF